MVKEVLDKWSQKEYLSMWIFENGGDPAFEDVPDNVNKDIEYLYKSYVETGKTVGEFMLYMDPIYSLNQDKLWLYYREAPKNHWTADELLEKIEIDIEEKIGKNESLLRFSFFHFFCSFFHINGKRKLL